MTIDLFTYGTLEIPEVMRAVTGRTFPAGDALLPGFARSLLRDRIYPGIRPDPAASVAGVLHRGVDADSVTRLDRFEGSLYRRESVEVVLPGGARQLAVTYRVEDPPVSLFTSEPWDRAAFVAQHLQPFLVRVRRTRVADGSEAPRA